MTVTYAIQILINALMLGVIYSLMALGFSLIFGIARIVNFAHGEIYMIGCFLCYFIVSFLGLPFPLGVVASIALAGLFGVVLELFLFRRIRPEEAGTSAEYPTVAVTLALSLMLPALVATFFGTTEKAVASGIGGTIMIGGVFMSKERLAVMVIAICIFIAVASFIRWHRAGHALSAVAQDREAAMLQGMNIDRISALAFGLGFSLAGVAGALMAPLYYVEPVVGGTALIKTFIVVIIGGIGSIPGTLLGGLLLGLTESVGSAFLGGNLPMLFAFLAVVIFLIFRPSGLLGRD
ncbi:MAG: branched-chain amino acid ABC transporter permease [Pseudomonadota bacterium]